MLTVTEEALQHLHTALTRAQAIDPACFRFTRQGEDAIGLVVGEPEQDDQTFECEGETVLAAPEPLADLLSRKVLDLDEDGQLMLMPQAS